MKLFYRIFPKDLNVSTLNKAWWFYIVLTILGTLVFTAYGNTLSVDDRYRFVLITSILEFIFLRFYKFYLIHVREDYFYFDNLPCFLCNQSTILCIIAALTRNNHLMAFCIVMGTAGSLLAFFFPDPCIANQPFYSFQTFGFYAYHALLIVTCLSFWTLGLYKPDLTDALWNMLILFLLAFLDHWINVILIRTGLNPKANYNFTINPDNGFLKLLYKYFPVKLYYMLPCLPMIGLVTLLFVLIIR
ncbi:MAG: YwaF family protein [Erysipelotrichaceae bacterium]|nr:YwaF family protein [Erysipelotrichaceae bacterium]